MFLICHARISFGVALLMISAACTGCGGGSESVSASTAEATVTGTVTLNGKLATGGELTFDPANTNRPMVGRRSATIGKDGRYTVTTLVGGNFIRLGGPDVDRSLAQSLHFDVKEGENTFDVVLPAAE
jgi:hypothetical protein